ncbi:MAG: cation:proton antiporter [Azospirillaceae bacterium]
MASETVLLVAALAVFLYGLVSAGVEKRDITPAIAALAAGAAIGFGLEAAGASTAPERRDLMDGGGLAVLAELALAIILFVDAASLRLPALRREAAVPVRLLAIGLPLLVLAGWALAWWMLATTGAVALMLALILAPTDAALSQPIFQERDTPAALRDGINVESGLNDGLLLPIFLAVVAGLATGDGLSGRGWIVEAAAEIAIGAGIGVAAGWAGSRIADLAASKGLMEGRFEALAGVALAISLYAGAELAGGNGFVAAFVGGLAATFTRGDLERRVEDYGETESTLLAMLTFLAFGALVLPVAIMHWDWRALAYAVASLAVLRPVAVWLALAGSGLPMAQKLYAGWFGPRGIASVLYVLIAIRTLGWEPHGDLFAVAALTVTLSVVAHGLTARPLSRALARRGTPQNRP